MTISSLDQIGTPNLCQFNNEELIGRILDRGGIFGLGAAYEAGQWAVPALDQFMVRVFEERNATSFSGRWTLLKHWFKDYFLDRQHGVGALEVGQRHYDLGNDLFKAMLDSSMTYTCGVWQTAQSLNQAQEAKLKLICDKLALRSGQRVLDIGCGWGNFAQFAAKHYGVSVVGLTISEAQAQLARERCAGLPVEILLQDYRDFRGLFDHAVSIEMIEAVGRRNIGLFFERAKSCIKPGGRFLIQAISAETFSLKSSIALDEFIVWIVRHIFPNGYLPKLAELLVRDRDGLSVEHLESFARDYDLTLMAWAHNFECAWPKLTQNYGPQFRRRWLFYLNSCAALFRLKLAQVYQILYSR